MEILSPEDYTHATLCFPVRGDEILLAEKQRKIGAGYLNGFGGTTEPEDKDIFETAWREVDEEIVIQITTATKVGEIAFHNPSDDEELKRMMVHIFTATSWDGEPTETNEMKKIAWYKVSELDFGLFLAADRLFIPQVLAGKCVRGLIEYNEDWTVKSSQIETVDQL